MKAKKILLLFLLSFGMSGYSATTTITALSNSVFSFTPNNVTINFGDIVHFTLAPIHDAFEVDGPASTTAPAGGFAVPFGGDQDVTGLSVGTHYYICQAHVSFGMRGTITVMALGVNDFELAKNFSVFPNPANDIVNVKVNGTTVDFPYAVIDQGGRILSEGKLNDITTTIDLRQLNSGIYFLQVGDDTRQTFKLIKR